jgi:hypothetical protein
MDAKGVAAAIAVCFKKSLPLMLYLTGMAR